MKQDIKKVLVIGSGALKIGEAGEFDYSGAQALKALREEGIQTILINPNIATVQTSEEIADQIYFLPITPYFVEEVIKKEQPDGVLLAFGGQTALNCGVALYENNIFQKYNVEILGTPVQSIIDSEDRDVFKAKMDEIGVALAISDAAESLEEAYDVVDRIGFPVIVRAAFTLGGLGSGFANNKEELKTLVNKALSYSPQVLIEESLKGWKEVEYEVVRDCYDNCITVCNMENFDPVGIHTGESIVVCPSQTLTNSEYHKLREISIKIARHVGIVGECNVQFSLDPNSEKYRVIEINARLSRSSALASKATGYPLAFVAAKLALGYGLFELKNSVTKTTPAYFEPALDYVVCKLPRWDLNKFYGVSKKIGSGMKSVGEVMAIGGSFEEVIQKGLRMLDNGLDGFINPYQNFKYEDLKKALTEPTDSRILAIAAAFEEGFDIDSIHNLTKIDKWFLHKLERICIIKNQLVKQKDSISETLLLDAKKAGFSDKQIGGLIYDEKAHPALLKARNLRKQHHIVPYVRQIDTLAAEFPAQTNYLYLTYHAQKHDIEYENDGKSVITLGSGVYRIGSSVEFDWCGVNTLQTINKEGFRSVMINYNPETVSTDYDVCDRLYFDELTFERVLDIIELETPKGVIVSMGGQIPNNLAMKLHHEKVNILGTTPEAIDNAENRHKFSSILDELEIDQPRWKELSSFEAIYTFADEVGFPLLIRPSYVLSGAAMNVVSNKEELEEFLALAADVSPDHPVVVSEFIEGAKEIEMDAVAKNGEIIDYAISEHVEFAGVHSGDATIMFPPQNVYVSTLRKIRLISAKVAKKFNISGPFNMQFLAKENDIKVIELNLRASRSFPFVSKVAKTNLIDTATQILLGKEVEKKETNFWNLDYVGVKASQFSFHRLQGADPVLGVDMSSTGEVGCIGKTESEAILKSMLSVGHRIPKKNILISSGPVKSKVDLLESAQKLQNKGYSIYATKGTHQFLTENGIQATHLYWHDEESEENVLKYIQEKKIDLVVNIPKNLTKKELNRGYTIRRSAVDFNIPLITNTRLAKSFIKGICEYTIEDLEIANWKEY
ncbi:carbamoyl-phosphate synthase (glutamine-hydrolyzing) [Flavobacteriaceae bacterium UJ101]|nr:carbamoyl-phosphate synthase (glutamine-hydrolyzing) [Flavobacteriaceae bacterium UJ101]